MPNLSEKVGIKLKQLGLFSSGEKALCAVSGGVDSMVLSYVLRELGFLGGIAHVNYQLRDASDKEALLVKKWSEQLGVQFEYKLAPLRSSPIKVPNLQMKARKIRYDFFESLIDSKGYQFCATGHHRKDQAETILMSITKGNSSRIIHGIPEQRGFYIRPLLSFSKEEIRAFAAQFEIPFLEDSSNQSAQYTRNVIRNSVLPVLEDINPGIEGQLLRKLAFYNLEYAFLEEVLLKHSDRYHHNQSDGGWEISIQAFSEDFPERFFPLFLAVFLSDQGFEAKEIMAISSLESSDSGKKVVLEKGEVVRGRSGLFYFPFDSVRHDLPLTVFKHEFDSEGGQLRKVGTMFLSLQKISFRDDIVFQQQPGVFVLDFDLISWPLTIRAWQAGDRMQPLGMSGTKKLKDIFVDEKFSPQQKKDVLIFEDQAGIQCVSGFRISESIRLNPGSQFILKIVIHNSKSL